MLFHGEASKPWQIWTRRLLWLKTLIGMLTGVALGVGFEEQAQLLKGTALDRIGIKVSCLYLCSTAIAICIGLMMGWLMEPGMGAEMGPYQRPGMTTPPTLASVLSHLVPSNPVEAMVEIKILQVIVFAVALAVALNACGRRGRPAILFFTSLAEGMFKLTQMVMALAPYGVCALMAWMISKYGIDLLLLLARLNSIHYFKSIVDPQAVAFTSSSRSKTLPISLACAEKRLGVSPAITARCCP